MMISPEMFVDNYKNASYAELLKVRDELIDEIHAFENHSYDPRLDYILPSPEVTYQCNLEYLGKLCELISEKYNQEFID